MIILPAIDLYGGKVVRLHKGDFASKTEYGDDPLDAARRFFDMGSRYLHIVDLEAAEAGRPVHLHILSRIAGSLDMHIHFGGGLRTQEAIRDAANAGAAKLMVGSMMFKTPNAPQQLFDQFGDTLLPSIDVKEGKIAVAGWQQQTEISPEDAIRSLSSIGYSTFLVTATEHDGMLEGPDMALCSRVAKLGARIIAAGGVTTLEQIRELSKLGVHGAVVGKALYEGRFDLARALQEIGGR